MTGNIKSVVIDANGWTALITVEGLSTAGTYNFGLGTNNDPSTAKIALTVTSPGYNSSGVLGTISRIVYGVPTQNPIPGAVGAVRKVYPNQASPDETISGSDVVIRVALSEFVYSEDTLTASIGSGWYTQGGTPSNGLNGGAVTNNSTNTYSTIPVIGNWAIPQCQLIVGSTLHLEFYADHRFSMNGLPVALVQFVVTDGTHSLTSNVTTQSISTDSPNGKIILYQADIDVSTLTNGVITAKAQCFPWVGNATSILNTNDGVNTFPTPLYTNLTARLDKTDVHGKTCVDSVNGIDGTGAVYSTQVLAEAGNSFLTIAAALTALAAYNNSNAGHNDAGGGIIYCKPGTYIVNTTNGGSMLQWIKITKASTATQSNAIVQAGASNSSQPARFLLSGITVSGSNFWYASGTKGIAFDNCKLATSGSYTVYNLIYGYIRDCTGTIGGGINQFNTYATNWALLRGNTFASDHTCVGFTVLGNVGVSVTQRPSNTDVTPLNDNLIFSYNLAGTLIVSPSVWIGYLEPMTHGFSMRQNILIRYGSQTQVIAGIGGDSTVKPMTNVIVHQNTFLGGRINIGYNDTGTGGPYLKTNFSIKNNIISNINIKTDTFGSNASATGNWSIRYKVGGSGNHFRTSASDEWTGEFYGLNTVRGTLGSPLSPVFVTDNSSDGGNTSGGDYHLQGTSPCKALTTELIVPFDYEGNIRSSQNASGVYIWSNIVYPKMAISETFVNVTGAWILDGGSWKAITQIQESISGVWKNVV